MMMSLPDDMIFEILLKLPVRSLLRLKTMCKSLNSLISDPLFATLHFEQGAARTQKLVLLEPGSCRFLSTDVDSSLFASSLYNLDFMENVNYLRIMGSCRGFLLLNIQHGLWVWNPSTGFRKFIGWSPLVSSGISNKHVIGFGYDSSQDEYLVIVVSEDSINALTYTQYFSFRTNHWKDIETSPSAAKTHTFFQDGCFLNGAIHWLAYHFDASNLVIVAFDLMKRSCSEISQPLDFDLSNYTLGALLVVREMLHMCDMRNKYQTDIWVMREYNLQASWTKTFVITLLHLAGPLHLGFFLPLCYTTSGDFVGIYDGLLVVKFDKQGQKLEHRFKHSASSQWAVYTESLLSFPCSNDPEEEE